MTKQHAMRRFSNRTHRAVLFCVAAALTVGIAGCSPLSKNDIKGAAIRRDQDDDEQPAAASKVAAPNKVAANKNAATRSAEKAAAEPVKPPAAELQAVAAADHAVTPQSTAPPSDKPVSDTLSPPSTPLDDDARAHRTVENLTRIGTAFQAYLKDKSVYPGQAVVDSMHAPLLSWRVALLPYLGYQDLHSQFHLDEPWNSRHNQALLAKIPSVYQSPERFDERTNYLVAVGPSTLFGLPRPAWLTLIEDGPRNTVFVVEADDVLAAPWTAPQDYALNEKTPAKNLGSLRGDSFFVVWGNGEVGRVLANSPAHLLRAMYTHDSGEDFVAGKIDKPLFPPTSVVASSAAIKSDAPHVPGGSSGSPVSQLQTSADPGLSSLSATYLENSAAETAAGGERAASEWFYAAALASSRGGSWAERYQWVPALRRPTPSVRFGIGLQYAGPRASELRNQIASSSGGSRNRGSNSAWSIVTAKYGEELVRILAAHCQRQQGDESPPAARRLPPRTSPLDASPGVSLSPGVYFLAAAREGVLREAARREGVDVLVFVDWREIGKNWSADITLVDTARGQSLLELPRFDSGQIEKARTDPLAENPAAGAFRKLSDFLEQQLAPQPLPPAIEPRHVVSRLAVLAASKDDNPLRALAEMRYYRERGLADDTQLLLAYQALIGGQPGSELMLGDAAAKARALKPWLPPPPAAPAKRPSSRQNDDD
jgi:hypothetical protein